MIKAALPKFLFNYTPGRIRVRGRRERAGKSVWFCAESFGIRGVLAREFEEIEFGYIYILTEDFEIGM